MDGNGCGGWTTHVLQFVLSDDILTVLEVEGVFATRRNDVIMPWPKDAMKSRWELLHHKAKQVFMLCKAEPQGHVKCTALVHGKDSAFHRLKLTCGQMEMLRV